MSNIYAVPQNAVLADILTTCIPLQINHLHHAVICVQYIWHKLICSLKEKFIEKILMYHLKQRFNFGVLDIFLLCSFFR